MNPNQKTEPNEKIKEARKQLEPLLAESLLAYRGIAKQILERLDRIVSFTDALLEGRPWMSKTSRRFFGIFCASSYLFSVELIGNFYVNLALWLLVWKGHPLHLERDSSHRYIRHAASLQDIESPTLPLSVKLDILESHGLTMFRKWIDTKLRNKIAHADFFVEDNGDFFLVDAKGRKKKVDLAAKIRSYQDYFNAISAVFRENLPVSEAPSQNCARAKG